MKVINESSNDDMKTMAAPFVRRYFNDLYDDALVSFMTFIDNTQGMKLVADWVKHVKSGNR